MWYSTYYKNNTPPLKYNEKYYKWMKEVEIIVYKKLNKKLLDLPDQMYMHYFENSLNPEDMAEIVFEDLLLDLSDEE